MPSLDLLLAVLLLAFGTYAIRLAGVSFGSSAVSRRLGDWSEPAVIVLLASVATTAALYEGAEFAGWARIAGVAVGAAVAVTRAPLVVVVLAASATTALLRALGVD